MPWSRSSRTSRSALELRLHPAHFHGTSVEHRFPVLFFAEGPAPRTTGSRHHLPLRLLAKISAAGLALFHHRLGLEFDDVRSPQRLVFSDGLRNVCPGRPRLPPTRPRLVFADGRRKWRHARPHTLGTRHHGRRHRATGSTDLAAGDRLGRQIQVRASGKRHL